MFSGIRIVEGTQQGRAALLVAVALLLLLARGFITIIGGAAPPGGVPAGEPPAVLQAPLAFEPNLGQNDPAVRFTVRQPAGTIYFSAASLTLVPAGAESAQANLRWNERADAPAASHAEDTPAPASGALRLVFLEANPAPELTAGAPLPGTVNYLVGNDPAVWRTDVPTHGAITYRALYPGVSLHYEGNTGLLKGTYTVAPGSDPARIRWRYEGARQVTVAGSGDLQIVMPGSGAADGVTLTERAPLAWQTVAGQRVAVAARYHLAADGSVGFALGVYDDRLPLIIDPTIEYSTYLGGLIADQGWAVAVDPAGNAYITGYTASSNFPTLGGYQPNPAGQGDAFVSKFSPTGALVYSTYLGGSLVDSGNKIQVDAAGNAYIYGNTNSSNFPTLNAFQPAYAGGGNDAFITKLNPAGNGLVYSTYLGGSDVENRGNAGLPSGLALDAAGAVYVSGDTLSTDFPTQNAYQPARNGSLDAFVAKIAPSGSSLVYSTYLGGERGDSAFDIAVDSAGNAIVVGDTVSFQFPTANAYQAACAPSYAVCWDVFVTKFNAAGSALVYSTYLGGNDIEYIDRAFGVTVDGSGVAHVTGMTGSNNFPLLNPVQSNYGGQVDAFISRFSPAGAFLSSTYLGGSNSEVGYDIAVNGAGNVYLTGLVLSTDFPTVNPLQPALAGTEDAFLAKYTPGVQGVVYATYFGGSTGREEWGATGIALDAQGYVFIAGPTEATNFPTRNPHQATNAGSYDAFLTKFADTTLPPSPTPVGCNTQYVAASGSGSIVPGTTLVPNSNCSNCVNQIALPFAFTLYGQTYTSAYVASNGTLRFVDIFIPTVNQPLPADRPQQTLLPYWDDLDTSGASGGIYTSVSGTAPNRIFNIEWRAHHFGSTAPANFAIRLYENAADGRFEFLYGDTGGRQGNSATVGVQEDFHGRYTQYSYNSSLLTPGLKVTFTLNPCGTPAPTNTPGAATATRTPALPTNTPGAATATRTPPPPTSTATPGGPLPSATRTTTPPGSTPTASPVATVTACPITFTDVDPSHPFYSFIRCLACRGILSGYADGTFRPSADVTRGQLAKILANAAQLNNSIPSTQQTFADVPTSNAFWLWIERLVMQGAISGYGCGSPGEPCDPQQRPYFRPYNNATRGQIAKITAITAQIPDPVPTTQQTFTDVPPNQPFWRWIEQLAGRGIINGYGCGGPGEPCDPQSRPYFRPGNPTTRGQLAKIAANTFYPDCRTPAR